MAETNRLIRLVVDQNSPDNNARKAAELAFTEYVRENPSTAAFELIMTATVPEDQIPIDVRQSCLLHLKRLVPKYWSLGFQLFVGPPIDQDLKAMIRQNLISLATSLPHSKIRAGSAYVIVQIAASDYPDEWPDLLSRLYELALKDNDPIAVQGGLTVLIDLFDDLITEDMFWEGGVGSQFLSHIGNLLSLEHLGSAVKITALNLYNTVYATLLSSEATALTDRKKAVIGHVQSFTALLQSLVQLSISNTSLSTSLSLVEIQFRATLYKTLAYISGDFSKYIASELAQALLKSLVEDFVNISGAFNSLLILRETAISVQKTEEYKNPELSMTNLVSYLLDLLSILNNKLPLHEILPSEAFNMFVSSLTIYAQITSETLEDYELDYNKFVTDSTGLSGSVSIRDSILEFLSNLNGNDAMLIFDVVNKIDNSSNWQLKEACCLISEGLFLNEKIAHLGKELSIPSFLSQYSLMATNSTGPLSHPLLKARLFLLIPRLMERFQSQIAVGSYASVELKKILEFAKNKMDLEEGRLIASSALISVTLWKNIESLNFSSIDLSIQDLIFELSNSLVEDSDEDTLPVLLEAISAAIAISDERAHAVSITGANYSVIELILKISFKDAANIQLIVDANECLELFLKDLSVENYLQVCEGSVPYLMQQISASLSKSPIEYTPELSLQLEMLCIIILKFPLEKSGQSFPAKLFSFVFPDISKLILESYDDQILQKAGEVFNAVIQKAPELVINFGDSRRSGTDILLEIASKFLSPDLSDSAAMNCGQTVISLFENFLKYLNDDFFFQLLQATVRRLAIAKSVVTVENLIMVFCKLVLNTSPELLIQALTSMVITDDSNNSKSGLEVVIPIWLDTFEVTRGFEKIKENVLALGKIYSMEDPRLSNLIVNGDLIPYDGDLIITRSMARSMPEQYTKIPVPQKIILLLAGELNFQGHQPDPDSFVTEQAEEGENGSDWEDLDDFGVSNYDKLKSYVTLDDDDEETSYDSGIKEILKQFFKECFSKNLGNFREHYENLSNEDKAHITENVIF